MQTAGIPAVYGALEAGGTKFVCALADAQGSLLAEQRLATTDPPTTLAAACAFLRERSQTYGAPRAVGVASFGPVHLHPSSPQYGCIGNTPKAGWSGTDMIGLLAREFSCPVGFDTDVNAAALAEHRWGAARGMDSPVYVTVGTGVGGGVLVRGKPLHGLVHPEIGHIRPRRHPLDRDFPGVCPFHGDCLEGLASGPAIVARSGAELHMLPPEHPQWELEADYLAQLCAHLVMTVSPDRIVLGGGVMSQLRLLPPIRQRLLHWLGGYVDVSDIDSFVVAPLLEQRAGVLGAVLLALAAERRG